MFNKLSEISQTPEDTRRFDSDPTLPLPHNKVGIEIEIEKVSPSTLHNIANKGLWKVEMEPSLRGASGELISVPVFGKDIERALTHMEAEFKKVSKPEFNARTSLHVHIEVVDLTKEELIRFILLYTALELVLFRLCDETRQNNPYCLPTWMSEGIKIDTAQLIQLIEEGNAHNVKRYLSRWAKYCAMNLNNIVGIGTIEFRQYHGTVNKKEIMDWVNILLSIKKYAKESMTKYNDFPEVVSGFMPQEYLIAVFGNELAEKLRSFTLADDLLQGVRCAQDILIYRRLDKATNIIYNKQSGKEPSSFARLTGVTIEEPYAFLKSKYGFTSGSIIVGGQSESVVAAADDLWIDDDEEEMI